MTYRNLRKGALVALLCLLGACDDDEGTPAADGGAMTGDGGAKDSAASDAAASDAAASDAAAGDARPSDASASDARPGDASAADAPAGDGSTAATLYDRLGGQAGIQAKILDFVGRVAM